MITARNHCFTLKLRLVTKASPCLAAAASAACNYSARAVCCFRLKPPLLISIPLKCNSLIPPDHSGGRRPRKASGSFLSRGHSQTLQDGVKTHRTGAAHSAWKGRYGPVQDVNSLQTQVVAMPCAAAGRQEADGTFHFGRWM